MSKLLHILKPIASLTSEAEDEGDSSSSLTTFTPTIIDSTELASQIEAELRLTKKVDLDRVQFQYLYDLARNKNEVYNQLAILFQYKIHLVKAMLETAIYLVGDTEMRIINRIFETVSEDMSAMEAVLCTKLMIGASKYSSYTVNVLYKHKKVDPNWVLKDIIKNARVTKEVKKGERTTKVENRVRDSFMKLEYCEKEYWDFPSYLIRLNIPKVNTQLRFVTDLPDIEDIDIKRARDIEEYAEAN